MKEKKDNRVTNYATIIYPESAHENWKERLQEEFVPCLISPLHDKDINEDGEGTPKKPHYHVMIMFDSKKSEDQAKEIIDKIGGVGVIPLHNRRGYARYLCHLDNPEKVQYDINDVVQMGGASYSYIIGEIIDKYSCIREMKKFIVENDVRYYNDLFDYAEEYKEDWFRALCDNASYVIKEYLKSRTYKIEREDIARGRMRYERNE